MSSAFPIGRMYFKATKFQTCRTAVDDVNASGENNIFSVGHCQVTNVLGLYIVLGNAGTINCL
jgi:hypothetical protein